MKFYAQPNQANDDIIQDFVHEDGPLDMDANFQATTNFEHLINSDMLSLSCILPFLEFMHNK